MHVRPRLLQILADTAHDPQLRVGDLRVDRRPDLGEEVLDRSAVRCGLVADEQDDLRVAYPAGELRFEADADVQRRGAGPGAGDPIAIVAAAEAEREDAGSGIGADNPLVTFAETELGVVGHDAALGQMVLVVIEKADEMESGAREARPERASALDVETFDEQGRRQVSDLLLGPTHLAGLKTAGEPRQEAVAAGPGQEVEGGYEKRFRSEDVPSPEADRPPDDALVSRIPVFLLEKGARAAEIGREGYDVPAGPDQKLLELMQIESVPSGESVVGLPLPKDDRLLMVLHTLLSTRLRSFPRRRRPVGRPGPSQPPGHPQPRVTFTPSGLWRRRTEPTLSPWQDALTGHVGRGSSAEKAMAIPC
jgi:hypothetical protein